jgi:hypothetical protein
MMSSQNFDCVLYKIGEKLQISECWAWKLQFVMPAADEASSKPDPQFLLPESGELTEASARPFLPHGWTRNVTIPLWNVRHVE